MRTAHLGVAARICPPGTCARILVGMTLVLDDWIGLRVARFRQILGLTQQQLADRVFLAPGGPPISRQYLNMIENGHKPVGTRRLLIALADGLGVATTDLTARPPLRRTIGTYDLDAAVPAIRAALDDSETPALWVLVGTERQANEFVAGAIMSARMGCDYPRLAALLPGAIARARQQHLEQPNDPTAVTFLAQTLVNASLAIRPLGYIDLATRMAEIAHGAALFVGDLPAGAAASYALSQCFLAGGVRGLRRRALEVASAATGPLIEAGLVGDSAQTWHVMLNLQAALAAATLDQDDLADTHLRAARQAVVHVQADPWLMDACPANVETWGVAVAVESSDPGRAPELASRVNPAELATVQRRAHLAIHTGHALHLLDDANGAIAAFLAAEQIAPAEVHGRARVREIVGEILRTERREAGNLGLRDLAIRMGVDPLAPPEGS